VADHHAELSSGNPRVSRASAPSGALPRFRQRAPGDILNLLGAATTSKVELLADLLRGTNAGRDATDERASG
jgi:hypothetical protein